MGEKVERENAMKTVGKLCNNSGEKHGWLQRESNIKITDKKDPIKARVTERERIYSA